MKLPRDLSGEELIKRLKKFGYKPTRQTGSHIRLTRLNDHEYHITIPNHPFLRVGTLNNILTEIARQLKIGKNELLNRL